MSYNVIYWQQINGAMDTEMWWNSPKWPWPKTKLPSCATVYSSVSMNICNIYIYVFIIHVYRIYVSMYLCIYVSMYLCIYVSMYLCIYVSMYLCLSVCMYINMCKGINISQKLILPPLDLFVTFSIGSCKGWDHLARCVPPFLSGLMVAPPTEAAIKIWTILSVHSVQPACVHVMGTRFAGDICEATRLGFIWRGNIIQTNTATVKTGQNCDWTLVDLPPMIAFTHHHFLVGGIPTPLKNISQLGLLFPIDGKINTCSKPPTSFSLLDS